MGKTSYKNTEDLIKEISEKVAELQKGDLGLDELNELANNGKDLFEHLVILRYKAFDKYGTPEKSVPDKIVEKAAVVEKVKIEKEVEEEEEVADTPFDFTGFAAEEEKEQPRFDFTLDEEKPKIEEKEVEDDNNDEQTELEEKIADSVQAGEDDEDETSLNQSLKQDEVSLRKKLQNTPIANIKSHISIAKKFEYISIMFDGDPAAYDEAIDFLNTCATGNDARLKLNELTTNQDWDLENKSIINFIELVERRYL
tara:strand:- start:12650 stop:13414 length:765 start_codon:yes stop_codon:yes gene_type:complete